MHDLNNSWVISESPKIKQNPFKIIFLAGFLRDPNLFLQIIFLCNFFTMYNDENLESFKKIHNCTCCDEIFKQCTEK